MEPERRSLRRVFADFEETVLDTLHREAIPDDEQRKRILNEIDRVDSSAKRLRNEEASELSESPPSRADEIHEEYEARLEQLEQAFWDSDGTRLVLLPLFAAMPFEEVFRFMKAVPGINRIVRKSQTFWRYRLILEFPEYYNAYYNVDGTMMPLKRETLYGMARKGASPLAMDLTPESVDYLLYQEARRIDRFLFQLATSPAPAGSDVPLLRTPEDIAANRINAATHARPHDLKIYLDADMRIAPLANSPNPVRRFMVTDITDSDQQNGTDLLIYDTTTGEQEILELWPPDFPETDDLNNVDVGTFYAILEWSPPDVLVVLDLEHKRLLTRVTRIPFEYDIIELTLDDVVVIAVPAPNEQAGLTAAERRKRRPYLYIAAPDFAAWLNSGALSLDSLRAMALNARGREVAYFAGDLRLHLLDESSGDPLVTERMLKITHPHFAGPMYLPCKLEKLYEQSLDQTESALQSDRRVTRFQLNFARSYAAPLLATRGKDLITDGYQTQATFVGNSVGAEFSIQTRSETEKLLVNNTDRFQPVPPISLQNIQNRKKLFNSATLAYVYAHRIFLYETVRNVVRVYDIATDYYNSLGKDESGRPLLTGPAFAQFCAYCDEPARGLCARCQRVSYCSEQCLSNDRAAHLSQCKHH